MGKILWGRNLPLPEPTGQDAPAEFFTIEADPTWVKKQCKECQGLGIADDGSKCPSCQGHGVILVIIEVSIGPKKQGG